MSVLSSSEFMSQARLQYLKLGDLSIDTYFRKIEYTASILKGLRSSFCDEDVVNIALEGLPPGYDNVYGIIVHREPFPDLKMLCFMLTTEKMRLRSWAQDTFIDSTSVSPLVLLANTGTNTRRPPPFTEKLHKPCFNFNKGACRFGFNASVLSCGTSTVETSNGNIVPMAFDMTPTSPLFSSPIVHGQQMIISSTFNVVTLHDLAPVGNDNFIPVTNSGYGMLPT
nr:hybrid signal transduction histidine kinase M [Tanacetum cinerariifolium]